MHIKLIEKLNNRTATIGIIGLGYVGLPLSRKGGSSDACLEVGKALYGNVIDQVVPVSSTRVAKMSKLLLNI